MTGTALTRQSSRRPSSRQMPKGKSSVNIISCAAFPFKHPRDNDEGMDTMKSILEEFACGNISPEPRFFKRDSRYGRAMEMLSDSEEKLLVALSGDEKETFKAFSDAQAEINLLSGIDKFMYGYRLGVLMTIEVYTGRDDLMAGKEVSL